MSYCAFYFEEKTDRKPTHVDFWGSNEIYIGFTDSSGPKPGKT